MSALEKLEDFQNRLNELEKRNLALMGKIRGLEHTQKNLAEMLISAVKTISDAGVIAINDFEDELTRTQQAVISNNIIEARVRGDLKDSDEVSATSIVLVEHTRIETDGKIKEVVPLACLQDVTPFLGSKVGEKKPLFDSSSDFVTIKNIFVHADKEVKGENPEGISNENQQ